MACTGMAEMTAVARPCDAHTDLIPFRYALPHLTASLKRQRRARIVAIGSSSTAGTNGILPYPNRLEMLLRQRPQWYGRMIDVINRGIGGQEAGDELSRFECDVIGEAPALVIWQVGTNAVFYYQAYSPDAVEAAIEAGLDWLDPLPIDVVLMDMQYTAGLVTESAKLERAKDIEARILRVAEKAGVNVFRRFALMQRWCEKGIPLPEMDDGGDHNLHMSEWATACVTQALFDAIAGAPAPAAEGADC
jgi:acyl-CoA thioesterase-1